jgi:hypothetical protein
LLFACFAALPNMHAVVPAPDGGYAGGNTAEGQSALFSLTSGGYNTAAGYYSLRTNTVGNFNTAIGAGTLLLNTGEENTATGAVALLSNTTGSSNTANGAQTLLNNTTGNFNTASGFESLYSNTTGDLNTANGYGALLDNTTGHDNTANGVAALRNNINGNFNTARGSLALYNNTTGASNTAHGETALFANTTGASNTAIGNAALPNNTTGSGNIVLGAAAGLDVITASNVIAIGNSGADVSNTCYIGNIFGAQVPAGNAAVFISPGGRLGTIVSSRRFKEEIKPMERASEGLYALNPVTFRYKKEIDPQGIPQFGLVAEEVEEVNPDLVVLDNEGKVNTVRYEQINAMLLNEFLKEHRKVEGQSHKIQEQEATITQLKKGMETVVARLEEQDSRIQKVSARLEAKEPEPNIVLSKQ